MPFNLTRIKIYLFGMLCLSACLQSVQAASSFTITEEQVNQYLSKQPNISDKLGLPGFLAVNYNLQNMQAQIGRAEPNRVELSGIVDGQFQLPNDQFPAKLNLRIDTIPYYDAQQGAIYLKDLRVLHLSGLPAQYQTQAQNMLPILAEGISALVGSKPIYTLDETDARLLMIKKFAKDIKVEKGQITLETTLF